LAVGRGFIAYKIGGLCKSKLVITDAQLP